MAEYEGLQQRTKLSLEEEIEDSTIVMYPIPLQFHQASRIELSDKLLILSIESWRTCKPCSVRATQYDLGM
jgi:hypothetical protein